MNGDDLLQQLMVPPPERAQMPLPQGVPELAQLLGGAMNMPPAGQAQMNPMVALDMAMNPAPKPPPTRRQVIGQSIGDFLQAVGAGLAHRGRAGQSTGAGAAMQTPFLLAQQRKAQEDAQRQQAMMNALRMAQQVTTQQNAASLEGLRTQQAAYQE